MSQVIDTPNPDYPKGYTPTPESEDPLFRVELPDFEGPLDLLLFLIKKHEMNILDLPVSLITERYLAHLNLLTELNIDFAADFLQMAAELTYIKSRMLVPQPQEAGDDDEPLDPRGDLIRRLLEFQKYKEAGEQLKQREVLGRDVFVRPVPVDPSLLPTETELGEVPLYRLVEALDRVLQKAKVELKHEVVMETLSVADKLQKLIERLGHEPVISFFSLFEEGMSRREIIAVFLSILEVGKMKLARLQQIDIEDDIILRAIPENIKAFHEESARGLDAAGIAAVDYR